MSKKKTKKPAPSGKINYNKKHRKQAKQAKDQNSAEITTPPVCGQSEVSPALRTVKEAPPPPSPVVTLEPLAPIVVRSGRPFDFQAGADAARFPPPSTLAGCLRTAWARASGTEFSPELAERAISGPLLARTAASGQSFQWLVPKPADAHYFGYGNKTRCIRAEPRSFEAGCGADLPEGLQPVRLIEDVEEKASSGPKWWDLNDLIDWRRGQPLDYARLQQNGWSPPAGDRRTHVAIEPATLAADAGHLFQTEGLDLEADNPWLNRSEPGGLRLLARFAEPLSAGLVHLGGERRLARLQPEPEKHWPQPPADWLQQIRKQQGLTLTLLTPGLFEDGYRPGWLKADLQGEPPCAPGLHLQLVAAALERWQPHSGWDLAKNEARATRKLVAPGATYWFRLLNEPGDEVLTALWLTSLCDADQDRRDGYGLALPAPWTPTV